MIRLPGRRGSLSRPAMDIEALQQIAPLPPALFAKHASKCATTGCWKCAWFKNGPRLRARCHFAKGQPWLSCCVNKTSVKKTTLKTKGQVFVGCEICRRFLINHPDECKESIASDTSKWGLSKFGLYQVPLRTLLKRNKPPLKHAKTRLHQLAMQWFLDKNPTEQQACENLFGPSIDGWKRCLNDFVQGKSARNGKTTSDQQYLMRWCLSEAMLQQLRQKVRSARVLVLIRDERQGRLQIRFQATLANHSMLSGLFGCEELKEGKKAKDITEATRNALKTFCTERLGAPRGFRGKEAVLDKTLFETLQDKIEMIVTDCASAELLAQDHGRGRRGSLTSNDEPLFPNARLTGRDRAHACGRLIERPWKSCPVVSKILEDTISGPESPFQKLEHSHTFSAWLAEAIEQSDNSRGIVLSAAKHRFASFSQPLKRFCLHLEPFLQTITKVGQSGLDWAKNWIRDISASKILALGMMADMSHAAIDLCRYCDKETMDIAQMNEKVALFLNELKAWCDIKIYIFFG